jgi:hypothetical protein
LPGNEAPPSKSPTGQSRYGDGALQGIPANANKGIRGHNFSFMKKY